MVSFGIGPIGYTSTTSSYLYGLQHQFLRAQLWNIANGFLLYRCTVILAVNSCAAEMVTYLPISSPFIRFAGRYVDEALGVAAGYNFFIFEATLVPFEVVACNMIIQYWTTKIHVGIIIAIILVIYALVNVFAVKWYGETEFWMAMGKVLLIAGLIVFTFVTMIGGNPLRDAYGFRYWKDPVSLPSYSPLDVLVAQDYIWECRALLRNTSNLEIWAYSLGFWHA